MIKKLIAIFALLFATLSFSGCAPEATNELAKNEIVIEDAWVRASEYSAEAGGMTGVFAKITNKGDTTVTLVGGSTDAAMMVQTHEVVDGQMQEKKGGIEIEAGQTVTLQPGGLHIMLMNLTKPIVVGDKIDYTFKFEGADSQTFTLTAKESEGGDETYTE